MSDPTNTTEFAPGAKERAIFVLKSLIELIENDQVAAAELNGKTALEIIAMAEDEAAKAVDNTSDLAGGR